MLMERMLRVSMATGFSLLCKCFISDSKYVHQICSSTENDMRIYLKRMVDAGFPDGLVLFTQAGCGPTATLLALDPFGCGRSRSGTMINITGNQRGRRASDRIYSLDI